MDEMYTHDENENPFASYGGDPTEGLPIISVNLPIGETLVVNGPRLVPLVITVSNRAERNPKRDARMLSTFLTCALDEQTVFHLAEYLFAEHLSPLMQDPRALFNNVVKPPVAKPAPKKKLKEKTEDEHTD